MALADKTRLRLLNLMRSNEVCVCFFTEVLGESQPKISRHLAYLRNAGLVQARRDGKWMHYSIVWPEDKGERRTMEAALDWLANKEELRLDLAKYETVCCTPELLIQIARTPIDFVGPSTVGTVDKSTTKEVVEYPLPNRSNDELKLVRRQETAPHVPSHNELEEFLL
ncbi:ArsR/SmtB family transcription factor [Leptolyngbya sp. 7M]|uniref:ArsR/SmtB family transcription factor n=1 Tax=Leptolyngbya sp. 7M TaxID=2812896 RepID=UPI001B8C3961|nr:metalloregulator ArsR/SmtB family transcription factor [Leptolyngbya sp. 7M]QYO65563.1 metalloregulator ArsR/SmtB family transcription factor [Leptolyngbya sp. 7M]